MSRSGALLLQYKRNRRIMPLLFHIPCATLFEVDQLQEDQTCPQCGGKLTTEECQAAAEPEPWLQLETVADAKLCARFGVSL